MPPKASGTSARGRGTAYRGRGRGGRGRGQVNTDANDAAGVNVSASSASELRLKVEDDESQSTLSNSPLHTVPLVTPFRGEEDTMDVDTGGLNSPASIPTETPASTPMRPSQNATPVVPPVEGEKKKSRFKPKSIRSSKIKREELAAEERAKKERNEEANERLAAKATRGMDFRGMRGRGRGDSMGRSRGTTSAGGLWGIAPESELHLGQSNRPGHGVGGSNSTSAGGGEGSSRGNRGGSGRSAGRQGNGYDNDFSTASFVDDGVELINIQNINDDTSEDEEEPIITGGRHVNRGQGQRQVGNTGGLKPIRLERRPHKPRGIVNADNIVVKKESNEKPTDSDSMEIDEERSGKPTGSTSDNIGIKDESYTTKSAPSKSKLNLSGGDSVAMDIDEDLIPIKPPSSPEIKKKVASVIKKNDRQPAFQTLEDKEEYTRYMEDRAILRDEMAANYTFKQPEEEEVFMGNEDALRGRTYLFQFPPRVPTLYNPLLKDKPLPPGLKPRESAADDVQITGSRSGANNPVDLASKEKKKVKFEEPAKEKVIKEEDQPDKEAEKIKEPFAEEPGCIGKLVVRKSGKVELIWGGEGGNVLEVNKGVTTSFLSNSALVQYPDGFDTPANATREQKFGVSSGMGKIMGKFVVSPDWETMF
ncbi:RNA polymerase III RPC4-domain-containing protein [Bisporella sp. PMI_857]|nr:RNA polymerase III RPC4-domain-containing protein [Bisporella sp. PMI_857]